MKIAISPLEQHPILADDAAKEIPLKGKAVIRQQHMNPGFNICSLTEKLPHTNGIRQSICRPFAYAVPGRSIFSVGRTAV
ncbi:hypothetical protein N7516_007876 [Penicillium verrucosum]|uniref:uncharacterized protein n=1 Tax=Penicillium verrucosum TaxID=60171 RepID=UPI0025452FEA|nr:uncharacterized protein N7516_007876 [Penicillium verrucosum]KAJ5926103.1 hypothetical protein N7516_007876 [Penicillium verrucosum]